MLAGLVLAAAAGYPGAVHKHLAGSDVLQAAHVAAAGGVPSANAGPLLYKPSQLLVQTYQAIAFSTGK